jgi:membrane associated rhomboid family serine protease
MATFSMYWLAVGALVVLYMVQDGASAVQYTEGQVGISPNRVAWTDVFTLVNVMLSPLSCGVSWTYWMDGGTLLKHHRTSLYTSVLLSLPVVISVQRQFLSDLLSRYTPPLLAHVLITEPLLKFMVIYVLTLSLETESVLEMLVVNATVTGICYVSFTPHGDLFNALVGLLVGLLVLLHVARLVRRAWHKYRPPATFTIA